MARCGMILCELGFPIPHPVIKGDIQFTGSREQVEMVRHENISADKPRLRVCPKLNESGVNAGFGQPRNAVFGTNGEEDNSRFCR